MSAGSKRRSVLLGFGAAALVGATVLVTLAVERSTHTGDHHPHAREEGHEAEGAHADEREGAHDDEVRLTPEMRSHADLELETAGSRSFALTISLPGEIGLDSERVAHVTPRVAGTVREVRKQLGDAVKRGEVLAVLDSRELAEMQREFSSAKERLELAEANYKRQEQLWQEKISAEKDYLEARQALAEARIEHRATGQKLAAGAGAMAGGGLLLTAPLDGTVVERHAVVGEVLNEQSLAFVVADLSRLWVNVTVYSRDLPRVRVGQHVTVNAEGVASPARGTIAYVDQVVGEQTRAATARVVLDRPTAEWRPGLFVNADIELERVEAPIAVLEEAVQRVATEDVVFVEREPGHFAVKRAALGRRGLDGGTRWVEVLRGLAPGERYVSRGSFLLKAELGKGESGHEH